MTLTSRSLMWVLIVQHKTSDLYLTSGKVSTRSIHGFKGYRLLKTLTKNFNILCNANAIANANANADAVVTAKALPVFLYRQAKKYLPIVFIYNIYTESLRKLTAWCATSANKTLVVETLPNLPEPTKGSKTSLFLCTLPILAIISDRQASILVLAETERSLLSK